MIKDDDITITAVLKRFTDRRLPRILDLEKKVLSGGHCSACAHDFRSDPFSHLMNFP